MDWKSLGRLARRPPRLGRLRGFFDRRADPAVRSAFDDAVRALAAQGAEIVELDDPVDFEQILKDHRTRDGRRGRGESIPTGSTSFPTTIPLASET